MIKVYEEFLYDDLKRKFVVLKEKWVNETAYQSNPSLIYKNSNYRDIIKMGKRIVPILIDDLNENNGDWLNALSEILDIYPIKKENEGIWDKMKEDWNNYLKENESINTTFPKLK